MDSKKQKMTDIVAKLLRQAEDVAGTPEEQVFHAKAFELMAKYGLDIANIEAHKEGLDVSQLPDAIKWSARISGKYAYQQLLLLHNISQALHCKTVYTTIRDASDGKKCYALHVFGVPRHVERVEMLWNILQPQMLRLVGVVRPTAIRAGYRYDPRIGEYRESDGRGQVKAFRRAWIAGFGSSVGERIREQEKKIIDSAGGGALVLYKDDSKRAEIAMRVEFPRVGKTRRNTGYNTEGYARGRQDGHQAVFNHSLAG
jgi:hypothetical protein